ncbi:hypothetical protein CRUP_018579 [Coryphaenoides rupestris]|nr:hypothetical protein CRUP_018579 [Coryphaenoides rupestris]
METTFLPRPLWLFCFETGTYGTQLTRVVTEPFQEHLLLASDFSSLGALLPKLNRRLCVTASEPPRPLRSATPVEERVIGPRDLQVSELAYSSVRLTWSSATGDVTGYRLLVTPISAKGLRESSQQRQIDLKSDVATVMVTELGPKTEYDLTLYAVYPSLRGDSASVSNFRVMDEGLFSLRLAWTPPVGTLSGFKLFIPRSNRPGLTYEQLLPGDASTHVIDSLEEDRKYTVSIYAVFPEGPSEPVSIVGQTLKLVHVEQLLVQNATTDTLQARWTAVKGATGYRLTWSSAVESGAVQSLKVAAVNTNSAVVSWNRVPGATGYRLAWGPTPEFTGRDRPRQLALNGSTTEYHLRNVVFDTEYVLSLYVLINMSAALPAPLGYVSNFKVISYTSTSIDVEWSPIVGATEYKVTWKTAAVSESELIQTVREVKVVDIQVNSISLSWRPTPGASGYKVSWSPFQGGGVKSQLVRAPTTTFTLPSLQESSAYKIQVSSMSGSREGSPALVTARTLDLPKVNGFAALNTTDSGTVLNWSSVAGASGYLLSWRHISVAPDPPPQAPVQPKLVAPPTSRAIATSPPSTAAVTNVARGMPKSNTVTTAPKPPATKKPPVNKASVVTMAAATTTPSPAPPTPNAETTQSSGPVCGKVKADIVFLVDESSSISVNNFAKMKDFIFRAATYFPLIGPQGTQIAIVPFSNEPRIEFRLNAFKDRNSLLRAIRALRYGGGNTRTGQSISFVLEDLFQESQGMRREVAHVLVLITDGRAQDDVLPPSRMARALGVSIVTVGVANADLEELKLIAAPTSYKNVFFSPTFEDFPSVEREFINTLCSEALLSEYKLADELDTLTGDPEDLPKPEGPCQSQCVKGQKGEKGAGFGLGGLRFKQTPGKPDPFAVAKGETGEKMGSPGCRGDREELDRRVLPASGVPQVFQGEPGYVIGGMEAGYIPGRKGEPGSSGPQGPAGVPGVSGAPGLPGHEGLPGASGTSIKGEPGEAGAKGTAGLPGPIGIDGVPGLPGDKGEKGEAGVGVQGVQGIRGVAGEKGKKGFKGEVGEKGERGDTGLAGPQGPLGLKGDHGQKGDEGLRGVPGDPAKGIIGPTGKKGVRGDVGPIGPLGQQGVKGVQGIKGEKGADGKKGDKGEAGEPGEHGERGLTGETGMPGPRGKAGIDGKRGVAGKDGEKGPKGEMADKGKKGEAGVNGATVEEIRQAFPMPMGPPGATGYAGAPGKDIQMKDIEAMFEAYGIRALVDHLLQDGIEELLHVLGSTRRAKESQETHSSNVIPEYTNSVKYELSSPPLSEVDFLEEEEEPAVDGQSPPPPPLSADAFNGTTGGPAASWEAASNVTESGPPDVPGVQGAPEDNNSFEVVPPLHLMNLTAAAAANGTFNDSAITSPRERVSRLPEVVVETAAVTQDKANRKGSAEKRKHRDRGKQDEEEEEEDDHDLYNGEEYSYEYEGELITDGLSVSEEEQVGLL